MADVKVRCADLPAPPPLPPARPDTTASAVLIPVFERQGAARIVFTKRPDTMAAHQGQVAFPGGKVDPRFDATPLDTVLREAEEEVGLVRDAVDVIAELPTVETVVGGFVMTPFVGIVEPEPVLVVHPYEVDRLFDVTIVELLDDDVFHAELWVSVIDGETRPMSFFYVEGETIWGATARILVAFLERVTGTASGPGSGTAG